MLKGSQSCKGIMRSSDTVESVNHRELSVSFKGGSSKLILPHQQSSYRHSDKTNSLRKFQKNRLERSTLLKLDSLHTRSVSDDTLKFRLVASFDLGLFEDIYWPISIRWPTDHPKCSDEGNYAGEFDIDTLLRFSVDHIINLPSRTVLLTCIRIVNIQQYFILLFWYMKLLFFDDNTLSEVINTLSILKHFLTIEFETAVSYLDNDTKDKLFTFLPLLLSNGVFYGYYYMISGSRRLYTESFHQNLYMNIVTVMYGIDLIPDAVLTTFNNYILDENIRKTYYYVSHGLEEGANSEDNSARPDLSSKTKSEATLINEPVVHVPRLDEPTVALTVERAVALTAERAVALTVERTVAHTNEPAAARTDEAAAAVLTDKPTVALTDEPAVALTDEPAVALANEHAVALANEHALALANESAVALVNESAVALANESAVALANESAVALNNEHASGITVP